MCCYAWILCAVPLVVDIMFLCLAGVVLLLGCFVVVVYVACGCCLFVWLLFCVLAFAVLLSVLVCYVVVVAFVVLVCLCWWLFFVFTDCFIGLMYMLFALFALLRLVVLFRC